jgi:hypothetical protein
MDNNTNNIINCDKKRKSKFKTEEERLQSKRESNLKSLHKLRYTEEIIMEKVKKYEAKLRAKMLEHNNINIL